MSNKTIYPKEFWTFPCFTERGKIGTAVLNNRVIKAMFDLNCIQNENSPWTKVPANNINFYRIKN